MLQNSLSSFIEINFPEKMAFLSILLCAFDRMNQSLDEIFYQQKKKEKKLGIL